MAEYPHGARQKQASHTTDKRIINIKKYNTAAYADIQKALTLDEQGNTSQAVHFYSKGLASLMKGLEIPTNEPSCQGIEWDEACRLQKKMKKTLQQMKTRLESLEQSHGNPSSVSKNGNSRCLTESDMENLNSNLRMEEELVELGEPPSYIESEANADEVFSIADGAQIYFINNKGQVSTPSMPSSLRIYEFTEEVRSQHSNQPPAFLQVSDWLYPLVKGQSPVLKSNDGAFIFLDMMTPEEGSSVGVMFTDTVNRASRALFEQTLKRFATICEQNSDGTVQMPRVVPPRPPPPKYSVKDPSPSKRASSEEVVEEEHRPPGWSNSISKGLAVGAVWLSWGLGKGAEMTVKYIDKGSKKMKARLKPADKPTEVEEKYQTGMQCARAATGVAVKVSGALIDGLCYISRRLAEEVAPHIRQQGEKYLKSGDDSKDGKLSKTLDGVVHVASSGLQGFIQVYHTLETAAFALAKSIQLATVDVVNHKYGDAAARLTDDALGTVGNLGVAAYRIDNLGLKAIAKRTAKDTTKAVVADYKEKPAQQTLGESKPSRTENGSSEHR
ncbi:spartin-like [Anneissia japonica]|uniref:spartin-like n=1 Tax=Anneissia japonica TaxID=1529436 RepID=UPI0014258228|nr:spartin-like [Anneissia japonica]